jgi:hypothetical protein
MEGFTEARRVVRACFFAFALSLIGLLGLAAHSEAAAPPLLTQFPEVPVSGGGAGQLKAPRAIAVDPAGGHVYVGDSANDRISEFDPWGSFVRAWGWGVADGSGELQVCGPPEPETSPSPSLCRTGISGSGAGQIAGVNGLAVDPSGDVFVFERENVRVQKFNPEGEFLLMFGGEVNKTTGGDVCTRADLEAGQVCGAGVPGVAPGSFSGFDNFFGDTVDVAEDGTVYVGEKDRIQLFEPDGTFVDQLPAPESGFFNSLAIDPVSGDLYAGLFVSFPTVTPPIFRLSSITGEVLDTIRPETPEPSRVDALGTASDGSLFASIAPINDEPVRVLQFSAQGEVLLGFDDAFAELKHAPNDGTHLNAVDTNGVGDVYVAKTNSLPEGAPDSLAAVTAFGPPPIALAPPPRIPPAITDQFSVGVGSTSATLRAKINPRFWDDTRFYLEFGTADCDTTECQQVPPAPGALLTDQIVNKPLTSSGGLLNGLTPGTSYHYRFVAESTGGGPVVGPDRTFTTSAVAPKQPACAGNQAFRPGPAAFLPDCRAYEMVSPVNKNGADISLVFNSSGDPAGLDQAATSGDRLTYSAFRAFGNVESAPYTSQYLAQRTGSGWLSNGISPPRRGPSIYGGGFGLDSQYKAFSPDLCKGWLLQDSALSLAEGSVPATPNVYRRDVCQGGYSALAPLAPPVLGKPSDFLPEVQGIAADGFISVVLANGKLTNNAAVVTQAYESSRSGLRLVCILPNRTALKTPCSAGARNLGGAHADRSASLSHAISEDGSKIYWTDGVNDGPLYVRVNHNETIAVSDGAAQFWTGSADGTKALYSEKGQLFEFDLESESSTPIAGGFKGLLGASDDASKGYFVSTEELDDGASADQPNLYRYEAGAPPVFEFIATLSKTDADGGNQVPAPVATFPIRDTSRVTPDGEAVTFMSTARLTGYDNTDISSGEANTNVYIYRAGSDTLACVSCNPTGSRAAGRDVKREANLSVSFWVSGQIPVAENQLHFPRVLSDDGTRLFFESFDGLVSRDTNSQLDVYEWEASGSGNCTAAAPGFHDSLGGCVNLISSGESPQPSELVDSSADGRDVFFKTASSLLPQDPGLIDIYDARADGGFPLPEPPPAPCVGEACQNPALPPNDSTPSSQTFVGPGDEGLTCPKGKHPVGKSGKERCVRNKSKKKRGGQKGKSRRAHR